jgi:hypothetical protein
MRKRALWLLSIIIVLAGVAGLFWMRDKKTVVTRIDTLATQAIDEIGDLLVSDDFQVYSVNSETKHNQRILQTEQPISSISYTSDHMVITVFDANDPKAFKGFYLRDKQSDRFIQYPTPQMSPQLSYMYGDVLFLASAEKIPQKDGDYFQNRFI